MKEIAKGQSIFGLYPPNDENKQRYEIGTLKGLKTGDYLMKLHYALPSPYVRKVRAVAIELGLDGEISSFCLAV